jgi:hypothetical protein
MAVARGEATSRLALRSAVVVVPLTVFLMRFNDASGALSLFVAPVAAILITVALAWRSDLRRTRTGMVALAMAAVAIMTEVATIGIALMVGGV